MNTTLSPIIQRTTTARRTTVRTTVGLAALALVAAACGTDAAESAPTEPAATEPATTEAASTVAPAAADPSVSSPITEAPGSVAGDLEIAMQVTFAGQYVTGTFDVVSGADVLGCEQGTLRDVPGSEYIERTHTCKEGDRAGTFRMSFNPGSTPGPGDDNSHWEFLGGTEDFSELRGQGDWSVVFGDGTGTESMSGRVGHGPDADVEFTAEQEAERAARSAFSVTPEAALVGSIDRLLDPDDPCDSYEAPGGEPTKLFGFVTTDGLHEYRTIGDTILVNDLATGTVTGLGPAPVPCALVVGDDTTGLRVVTSQDFDRFWSGPLDGPLTELDVEVDTPARLLSRDVLGNRFLVAAGSDENSTVSLIDATNGDVVGSLSGLFLPFPAWAVSPDGERIVIGSAVRGRAAGDGLTYVLDAATGTELFTVDTPAPASAVAFDGATGELLLGTASGDLVTVDGSGEIVATVATGTDSEIYAVGSHADDGVTVASVAIVALVDRLTGPVGDPIEVTNAVGGRVRPDGTALLWDWDHQGHVIDPAAG